MGEDERNIVYHLRNSEDKKPPVDLIQVGEIAMSYSAVNPPLYIKDINGNIITFPNETKANSIVEDKTKDCITDVSNLITSEEFSPVETAAYNAITKDSLGTINGESIEIRFEFI